MSFWNWLKGLFTKKEAVEVTPKPITVTPEERPSYFAKALAYVLLNEGGYTNDPADSGGATNWGITIGDLKEWRGKAVTPTDVKNMTRDEAAAIYKAKYWTPVSGDKLESEGAAICIFDCGVLYGVTTSAKIAQRACINLDKAVAVDGRIGPASLAAINSCDPKQFVQQFYNQILARIDAIVAANPKNAKFKKGWINRANRLLELV